MAGFSIVTRQAGGRVRVREVDAEGSPREEEGPAAEASREYREAQGRIGGTAELSEREVRRLAGVLEGGAQVREAVVEALTSLARSGRPSALSALEEFAAGAPRELAALARLALDECELWGAEPTPLPGPSPLRTRQGADRACGCGSGRWRRRCCEPVG